MYFCVCTCVDAAKAGNYGPDAFARLADDLLRKMRDDTCPLPVKLFLARLVTNRAQSFREYADAWWEPFVHLGTLICTAPTGASLITPRVCGASAGE